MTKAITASLAFLLALIVTACGPASEKKLIENGGVAIEEALHANDATADIDKAERDFAEIKAHRHVSEGWASEVRPGDTRGMNEISTDLSMMNLVTERLNKLGDSDRVRDLQEEIRSAMIEDCRQLLMQAEQNSDLDELLAFLRFAPNLDTSLEEDFGVNAKDLRAKALVMAKRVVASQRIRPTEGDPIGTILREWQFTQQELGLSAKELAEASQQ